MPKIPNETPMMDQRAQQRSAEPSIFVDRTLLRAFTAHKRNEMRQIPVGFGIRKSFVSRLLNAVVEYHTDAENTQRDADNGTTRASREN